MMKKSKLLVAFLCCVLSIGIMNTNVSAKTNVLDISKVIGAVTSINSKSAIAKPQFSSGGVNNTHQFIVKTAVKVLKSNKGSSALHSGDVADIISCYADWPDEVGNETDYGTFSGHFYDPDTGKNWLGNSSPTAMSRALSYFNQAVSWYKQGEYEEAYICIGKGSHYVADLNEPHHASNLTAVNSNHSEFEKYVNSHLSSYALSSLSSSVYTEAKNSTTYTFLQSGAKYAKSLISKAKNKTTYDAAGKACVQHAIINEVQYLYKFAVTVGIY